MSGVRLGISGTAVVCCVHDREKAVITDEVQVRELGAAVGQVYDPAQHKIHLCACCSNLFVDLTDVPRFCSWCRPGRQVHKLGGPLPEPRGVV